MSTSYLASLDGLRGVSILLVVLAHLGLSGFIPGGFGVTVFFFISGFIICRGLLFELESTGNISLRNFYLRRFFRLAPALLVYVAICLLAFKFVGVKIPVSDALAAIFYFANYYHIFFEWGGDLYHSPLSIVWSLSIEEHFYFVFPFLLIAFRSNYRKLIWFFCFSVLLVLIWRSYIVFDQGVLSFESPRTYKSTDTRIDSLVYGCICALIMRLAEIAQTSVERNSYFWLVSRASGFLVVFASAVVLLFTFLIRDPVFRESIRYSIQSLCLFPLFFLLFSGYHHDIALGRIIGRFLSHPSIVFVGKISYSLYLYHWLSFSWLEHVIGRSDMLVVYAASVPLMIVLTLASYYFVENPMRKLGGKIISASAVRS